MVTCSLEAGQRFLGKNILCNRRLRARSERNSSVSTSSCWEPVAPGSFCLWLLGESVTSPLRLCNNGLGPRLTQFLMVATQPQGL